MTQKERSLLTLKAIIKYLQDDTNPQETDLNFLLSKIDACFELIRPEVLLSKEEKKIYEKEAEALRRKGKII